MTTNTQRCSGTCWRNRAPATWFRTPAESGSCDGRGAGKRGGLRIIYYVQDAKGRIWLLTLYAKSARENIAAATLRKLKEVIDNAEIE